MNLDDLKAFLAFCAGGFFMTFPPELLNCGRHLGLVFVACVAGELTAPATCLAFPICSQRSGRFALLEPRISEPWALEPLLLFVVLSWRFKPSFQTTFAAP